ncbi:hypothetical protein M2140_000140 [Clostridiales Family XIII bacterium PM5-7]
MEGKKMSLEYSSTLVSIADANPSFDLGVLRVAYTGKNRNGSFISKESFERAIPSMFGCPVVANYIREEDTIGSHDGEIVVKENGNIDYVNITEPVGFVPPGAQWKWEIVQDEEIHQYLTTEVVLWKRQEAYANIKENGIVKQSMEITVTDSVMLDDYFQIDDFYFTAFCLLGTAEPCFESASLEVFEQKKDMQSQLNEMFEEFKLAFATDDRFNNEGGGEDKMDKKVQELLEKYSITEEEISFEIEGLTDEELESKFEEVFGETEPEDEPEDELEMEVEDEPESDPEEDNFALSSDIGRQLYKVISSIERIECDWGSYPRFYMMDFDESASEVYFEDGEDEVIYGAPYTLDGDDVVIDFENKKRKKFAFVDYVEGNQNFSICSYVCEIGQKTSEEFTTKYEQLNEKYQQLLDSQKQEKANDLFAKFEAKLSGDQDYSVLKSEYEKYSLEEIETKLFAMIGKKNFELNNTTVKKDKSSKVTLDFKKDEEKINNPYDGCFNSK